MVEEIKTMDERKNKLINLGKKQGYITYEQLADELKGLDIDSDVLDDLYNSLVEVGIEIVAEDGSSDGDDGSDITQDISVEELTLSKDVKINDPVRMYLKEIGRINLLTSDEEFEYARRAIDGDEEAKKMLAEDLKQRAHKLEKIKKDAEELAAKLEGVSLTIATKVSSTGTIFGSVGNIQIAEQLSKLGFEIDRKTIVVKDAVKEVGSYKALVKLHKEVSVEVAFEVVAE